MSLIVAIKDKDRIVVGSDRQASTGYNKSHDATKIWELDEVPGAVMGSVGSARISQILQFAQILDLNEFLTTPCIDTAYVVNSVVPAIVAILKINGINCSIPVDEDGHETGAGPLLPNIVLFAYLDRAWMIWNDLSVTELTDYLALGSGSDLALGALFATPKVDPFTRIVTCIDAAAESTLYVDHGVDLVATAHYKSDLKYIKKALAIEDEPVEVPKKPAKKVKKSEKTDSKKAKKDDKKSKKSSSKNS